MNTGKIAISKIVYYYKMQAGTDNKIKANGLYETPKNELVDNQQTGSHRQFFENNRKDTIDYDSYLSIKVNIVLYKFYRDLEQSVTFPIYKICASSDVLIVSRKQHFGRIYITTVFLSFMTEKLCLLILLRAKYFPLLMK